MAALLDPNTSLSLHRLQNDGNCRLCEAYHCYLNGETQWEEHLQNPKHTKLTKGESLTSRATTRGKGKGIVIPKSTAFAIEQSALYNDATSHYVFSLYRRCLLQARL